MTLIYTVVAVNEYLLLCKKKRDEGSAVVVQHGLLLLKNMYLSSSNVLQNCSVFAITKKKKDCHHIFSCQQ